MSPPLSIACCMVAAWAGLCVAAVQAPPATESVIVSGSASYRQRIAMPPDAVLSVRFEARVDLLLDAARQASPPGATPAAPNRKVAFLLPATFAGVMPCADCPGIAHTLTLRADGLYRLRRTYLGRPGEPVAEVGRWTAGAAGTQLALRSGARTLMLEVRDASTLRLLDSHGQPIHSAAKHELRRTAEVDAVTEALRWRGEFRYLADAATFTDCASGLRWPVAMAADYLAAERSYASLRSAPGAPLMIRFDGRLEVRPAMEGLPREQMVVDRFGAAEAGAICSATGKDEAMAALKDTYWKLIELDGRTIAMAPAQRREVRITLASEGARAFGFSGCNTFSGGYEQDGGALRFTRLAGTRMACQPPLMELEAQVLKVLGATTGYRVEGERLSLLAGDQVVARFESVYLR